MSFSAAFVRHLATAQVPDNAFNPYAGASPAAVRCRSNLEHYLELMDVRAADILLVGEAPGYRGCRLTGIPFTSEHVLASHPLFAATGAFQIEAATRARPQREASATIVWNTLDELNLRPLLWNVFPFHPYRPLNAASNRPPTAGEIRLGEAFMQELLAGHSIKQVVAVGKRAARALAEWGVAAFPVRHPAHGGGLLFRRQLAAVAGTAPTKAEAPAS